VILAVVAEGLCDLLKDNLEQLLHVICQGLGDPASSVILCCDAA
jgi:hypothetical protein